MTSKKTIMLNRQSDLFNTGEDFGFESQLFKIVEKLRWNMELSEYKHIVLGLIFLRYISNSFEVKRRALLAEDPQAVEDKNRYFADGVFWVPPEARWEYLKANAQNPEIGRLIDEAMYAIEQENEKLKDVLPKNYSTPILGKTILSKLIKLFSEISFSEQSYRASDVLGRVYEYFLVEFARNEGRRGGEFYTPRSVVRLMVEMLEPFHGSVYDPCCGSGGMFIQSEKFVKEHGGHKEDITIYGQELNRTTWRLCKMNMVAHGIDADIRWNSEGTLLRDEFPDFKFDYILANPPFNISDWGSERLSNDSRWEFGVPPANNANFAWFQHIYYHLAPNGVAGVVMANSSLSSNQVREKEIRKAMVEADVVDCVVMLPDKLFYSTSIPVCIWFLARNKNPGNGWRDRRGQVLFIDVRDMGGMVSRTQRELTDEEIKRIADIYHAWRGEPDDGEYVDVPGFCKSASIEEIRKHDYVLTPRRYVGVAHQDNEDEPFEVKMKRLVAELREHQAEAARLDAEIWKILEKLGYGG